MKIYSKKNKVITIILLLILSFTAGSGITLKLAINYYEKLFDEVEFYNPAFNIGETVTILRFLQTKQYEKAIHFGEWRLDDNIVSLYNNLNAKQLNNKHIATFTRNKLIIAAKYRKQYPYDINKTELTKTRVNSLLDSVLTK